MALHHKTSFVFINGNLTAARYQHGVLDTEVIPLLRNHRGMQLLHDGAPAHRTNGNTAYLNANNVNVVDFPPKSQDLNIIETFGMNYEGCSNMNASSFITFFTYLPRQNGNRFYKGLYVPFKLTPDLKKNTVYLASYSPSNEGHVSILTNSMLRTNTSGIDECMILR